MQNVLDGDKSEKGTRTISVLATSLWTLRRRGFRSAASWFRGRDSGGWSCCSHLEPLVLQNVGHWRAFLLNGSYLLLDEITCRCWVFRVETASNVVRVVLLLVVHLLHALEVKWKATVEHAKENYATRPHVSLSVKLLEWFRDNSFEYLVEYLEGIVRLLGHQLWRVVWRGSFWKK